MLTGYDLAENTISGGKLFEELRVSDLQQEK
jgi:hypothetical protein